MVAIAVTETNRYADQKGTADWVPVTEAEIYTLIALQLAMGVFSAPEVDMYFGVGMEQWGGLVEFNFSKYMTRLRFWQLRMTSTLWITTPSRM